MKRKYRDLDQYKSFFFLREVPVSDNFLDQLADDVLEWARKEDSLKMVLFLDDVGVNDGLLRGWMNRHERLKVSYEWAMRLLGARREIGTIKGYYREKPIMHTLYQYDPDWKAADEYHVNKALQANTPEYVNLHINPITVEKKDDLEKEYEARSVSAEATEKSQ